MHRSGPVTMSVVTEHGAAVVGREEELTTIQSFVTFHPSPAARSGLEDARSEHEPQRCRLHRLVAVSVGA